MTLVIVLVVVMLVTAFAAAAGVFDRTRGVRRRTVVEPSRPVREVVSEREIVTERDERL